MILRSSLANSWPYIHFATSQIEMPEEEVASVPGSKSQPVVVLWPGMLGALSQIHNNYPLPSEIHHQHYELAFMNV